jgi:hypothetical protein
MMGVAADMSHTRTHLRLPRPSGWHMAVSKSQEHYVYVRDEKCGEVITRQNTLSNPSSPNLFKYSASTSKNTTQDH